MKYQIEEKFGKWVIVRTEEPFEELKPSYPDKKAAEDQLRRLTQAEQKKPKS
jgi:hypothetical protein